MKSLINKAMSFPNTSLLYKYDSIILLSPSFNLTCSFQPKDLIIVVSILAQHDGLFKYPFLYSSFENLIFKFSSGYKSINNRANSKMLVSFDEAILYAFLSLHKNKT